MEQDGVPVPAISNSAGGQQAGLTSVAGPHGLTDRAARRVWLRIESSFNTSFHVHRRLSPFWLCGASYALNLESEKRGTNF